MRDLQSVMTEAGGYLMENINGVREVFQKRKFDYVTEMDIRTENFLRKKLSEILPGSGFSGEEKGSDSLPGNAVRWIVDPLDGTTNYIHGVPFFSLSVALEKDGEVTDGAVYCPWLNEFFSASSGQGAYLNGDKISVSSISCMEGGLFATGFPFRAHEKLERYITSFKSVFLKASGIRRCGSAALDLCFVACGRFDGFWEDNLSPWDIAAGMLLVREAGGEVTDFSGNPRPYESGSVICSNKNIFPEFFETAAETYTNFREGR